MQRDNTAENILERLSNLERYPDEALAPYKEFLVDGKTYYFALGGFLYRKKSWKKKRRRSSCDYLTDEIGATGPTTDSSKDPFFTLPTNSEGKADSRLWLKEHKP